VTRRLVRKKPEPSEEEKPLPLLYNAADACFMLGKISEGLLWKLVQDDKLHPIKVGRRSLFTRGELERFVRERAG
jgi:hypothetical protein